ncbi:MAG TPA: hypoxanthine phosphoribosyltransferase [Terriglobia bacterium]|nr:hypoxanthine phosphoribosyltransferase [Terriglobia bacterium]
MSHQESKARIELLLSEEKITQRVRELGAQISADYQGRRLHVVGILKGAWVFLADLVRHIDLEVTVDFLGIASYGTGTTTSGQVKITKDLDHSIEGLDVLAVEDILDTGLTFTYLQKMLTARKPRSLKLVALLDKAERRIKPVHADYVGFTIPDLFVVGYGLDYGQKYRQLRDVCVLHPTPEDGEIASAGTR